MSIASDPISLRLPPNLLAGVEACAAARRSSPAEAVEHLVREGLTAGKWLDAEQREQVVAEGRLMAVADDIVARIRKADRWGDDVTFRVFEKIRTDHSATYDAAIGADGSERSRINRQIGGLVRRRLDAEVVVENGYRRMGQVPRGTDSLIKVFTVLRRRGKAV